MSIRQAQVEKKWAKNFGPEPAPRTQPRVQGAGRYRRQVHRAPKVVKKKAVGTSRRQVESPKLSGSVEEYPRQHHINDAVMTSPPDDNNDEEVKYEPTPHADTQDLSLRRGPRILLRRYQLGWMTRPYSSYSPTMVWEFYESYRATVVLSMRHHPSLIKFARQPQLDHTLVKGVRVDVRKKTISRVMLGPNYVTHISIVKCDHRLRIIRDCYIIHDIEHRVERVKMDRWITNYMSPQGDEAPWIKGPTVINKGL
ncbi:hypothetical protein FXO38_29593 [Capsicum annuum]|nr:hypothetical protein FXO38_29593 [Capsicum annuum]KAF3626761.1 hypothetical protein FXO37_30220 [Capsicum annuum]